MWCPECVSKLKTADVCWLLQVLKEPADVAQQRREAEAAANAARLAALRAQSEEKTKMKGRNKPTRRQKKKQMNIIEDKKPVIRAKVQEEVGWDLCHVHSHCWLVS